MAKSSSQSATSSKSKDVQHPFRRAVLRGLAIVLPPLLTVVVFLWAWNLIESYVLHPVEAAARYALVEWIIGDIREEMPEGIAPGKIRYANGQVVGFWVDERFYTKIGNGQWIPQVVYDEVMKNPGTRPLSSGESYYARFVDLHYLRRTVVIPVFLSIFILVLYIVGKSMAAGAGRFLHRLVEGLIQRLPIIRNVYGSVKQVTDFVFTEQAIEFNRVVAIEYPRKGIWSVGFVTGESMLDIRSAANQPVLSVLMPTSPMPATGFTVTVLKSETVDLNITVDQAIQFVVSCGVVVPEKQQHFNQVTSKISAAITNHERRSLGQSAESTDGNGESDTAANSRDRDDSPDVDDQGNDRDG